jgi:hypothetical protein
VAPTRSRGAATTRRAASLACLHSNAAARDVAVRTPRTALPPANTTRPPPTHTHAQVRKAQTIALTLKIKGGLRLVATPHAPGSKRGAAAEEGRAAGAAAAPPEGPLNGGP